MEDHSGNMSTRNRNIGRGNACPQCRARKLKCDGVKPVCGPCMTTRRRSVKMIANVDGLNTDLEALISSPCYDENADSIQSDPTEQPLPKRRRKRLSPSQNGSSENTSDQSPLTPDRHIHLPGLPNLDEIRRCVEICYEEFRLALIFQPKKLMERLKLPSDHRNFPHPSVLHVFVGLAYAARPRSPSASDEAHRQHCAAAHEHIRHATQEGLMSNPLDIVRASLLLVMKLYGQGDLLQSYVACAEAIRLCLILNLHQDPSTHQEETSGELFFPLKPFIANRSVIRLNFQDSIEQEEVRRTMLLAFMMDRMSTIVTLWPTNLNERDYKADLPHYQLAKYLSLSNTNSEIESLGAPTNTFKLQNMDLLNVATGDLEQFLIKGGILFGRCAEHSARLPEHSSADEIKSTGLFIQMETNIALLQLGIHQMNDLNISPFQVKISQDVVVGQSLSSILSSQSITKFGKGMISVAHILPHACNLMLHDPLSDLSQESRETCNAAIQEIIRILRLIALHAAEEVFCQLDITLIISITITGQSLIRELQRLYLEDFNNYFTIDSSSILDSIKSNATKATLDHNAIHNNDQGGSLGYIRAYLNITLLSLRQIGKRWRIASQLHDRLIRMLEFRKDDQRQGMIFSGHHRGE